MKKMLLALIAIVLVSGCLNLGGTKSVFGFAEVTNNPDIYLKIESVSQEIKSGRFAQLEFIIENKGDGPLEGVNITAYDQCIFTGDSRKEIGELRANRSSMWNWKWEAGSTDFDRDCTIKFRTEYETDTYASRTYNVLDETEYYAREEEGTLGEISGTSSSSTSSLRMDISFSDPEPFMENEEIYVYINYNDDGWGIIKDIQPGSIVINVSSNLIDGECVGYAADHDGFILKDELRFVDGKAPSTACKFKTFAEQPIEVGEIRITAKYKYQFDNSLLLKVTPR